jgi:hypothetical protein
MRISWVAILARSLLGAVLVSAAVGFFGEVWTQERSCEAVPSPNVPVLAWRLGTPPVEALRHFLGAARALLPRGAVVGFTSPEGPIDAAFFRRLWAAYLEPDLNVVDDADRHAHYILAYGLRIDRPGVHFIHPLPGGGLYQIGRPR